MDRELYEFCESSGAEAQEEVRRNPNQSSVISHQSSVIGYRFIGYRLSVIRDSDRNWLLITDHW